MYHLIRTPPKRLGPPQLDAAQQAVVDHPGGPLLVLAGPGTGKTTTIVESVVHRIETRGATPDAILVLTFSRKAAADLRARIADRLGRTVVTPVAMTFHAFCYALVRRFADRLDADADAFRPPVRLLTGPEQDFRVRETLLGSRDTGRPAWPASLDRAFPTRAFASEVRAVLAKARQLGMDPADVATAGEAAGRAEWVSVGQFFDEYLDVLDAEGVLDYAELVHRCRILLAEPEVVTILRREIGCVFVDEYQDTDPSQVKLLQAIAGNGRDVVAVGDPDQSIYAFRGAESRGILDFPDVFRTSSGNKLRSSPSAGPGASAWACWRPVARSPADSGCPEPCPRTCSRPSGTPAPTRTAPPAGWRSSRASAPGPRLSTSPRSCAAPTCATGWPGTRWPSWFGLVGTPSPP